LQIGADKVAINSAAIRTPELLTQAAQRFGSQCIVVSLDALRHEDGRCEVLIDGGYKCTGLQPAEAAKRVERAGAGEILLTAIHRDGTMLGYDVDLMREVVDAVDIPVIINGGAGLLSDLVEGIKKTGASAAAASSLFAFTDNKPVKARAFMLQHHVHVRPI
jgi:cyclase